MSTNKTTTPHTAYISFQLDSKKVLNSNRKLHHIVNAQIVSYLRTTAAEAALLQHPDPNAALKFAALQQERAMQLAKKRAKSTSKRGSDPLPSDQQLDEDFAHLLPPQASKNISVQPLFDAFSIRATISPPTKRRMDPPNLYPTIKALIDGLTDASWWSDDDYTHLKELSFRYGTPTQQKNTFLVEFDIQSTE